MKKIKVSDFSFGLLVACLWAGVESYGPLPPMIFSYLELAWADSKLDALVLVGTPLLLALMTTWGLFLFVEIACMLLAKRRPWVTGPAFRASAFFTLLTPIYLFSGNPLGKISASFALIGFLVSVLRPVVKPAAPLKIRLNFVVIVGLCFAFYASRKDGWQLASAGSVQNTHTPSFLWVALDGIPAELSMGSGESSMDAWSRVQPDATLFREAYSAVNSTYASWFSALSGRYPFRSGVDTAFPHTRFGAVPSSELLPRRLKDAGYETVFMTDCASQSYFSDESGFVRRYEPDRGATGCLSAYLKSRHFLMGGLLAGGNAHPLIASFDSACSLGYRPETLFEKAHAVAEELNRSKRPYFLAVHSCATSPNTISRPNGGGLTAEEMIRRTTPSAMRAAKVLVETVRSRASSWAFLFSDHGVALESADAAYPHASEFPTGRSLYNVPLLVVGDGPAKRVHDRVSLVDLYPTVLTLAGLFDAASQSDGADLLQPQDENRRLVLASALPLPVSAARLSLLSGNMELGRHGGARFTHEYEGHLRRIGSIALLQGPFRFLFAQDGDVEVFEEVSGKVVETPLKKTADAFRELCKVYKSGICREAPREQG